MGKGRKEDMGRKGEGKRRKWLGRKGGTEEGEEDREALRLQKAV